MNDDTPIASDYHTRKAEEKVIEDMLRSIPSGDTTSSVDRLRARQKELQDQLAALEVELYKERPDSVWLRKLPEWFWLPAHATNALMRSQSAARNVTGVPTLYHWRANADLYAFGVNIVLGLMYLAMILALLGMLL
jgi:hypothetical protein